MKKGFTLAEVLITLGIIGVVAALVMPSLIYNHREKEMVSRLLKFISSLDRAASMWKAEIECTEDISTCLGYYNLSDSQCTNFEPIAKKMRVVNYVTRANKDSADWLPDKAYNYYGDEQTGIYGGVSKTTISDCAWRLQDGTIFSIDINPTNFDIVVDVNGKKTPNRVGKDIFLFLLGGNAGFINSGSYGMSGVLRDVIPYPLGNSYNIYSGICKGVSACNPENLNPALNGGASPTAYVLLNKKLPDFRNIPGVSASP